MRRHTRQGTLSWGCSSSLWMVLWVWAVSTMTTVRAQGDECSCVPTGYTFQLNFSASCPPNGIVPNNGIEELTCNAVNTGNGTDVMPVRVTLFQFLDLGLDLRVADQQNINGDFEDGDTVMFTSITSMRNITGGMQLIIGGVNAANETITNTFLVVFTNDCNFFPVFVDGDTLGWVIFRDLAPPRDELCPAAPQEPSSAPSGFPTAMPTFAPTMSPTGFTSLPTSAPTGTSVPVAPVTPAPVMPSPVTPSPSMSMSMMMMMSMSMSMDMYSGMRMLFMNPEDGDFLPRKLPADAEDVMEDWVMEFGRSVEDEEESELDSSRPHLARLRR